MDRKHSSSAWFLAQLKPNSHQIAARHLARQGFRSFLPLQAQTLRAGRRFTTRMRPVFPGYIFVALDLTQGGWQAVNSTQGITRLVSLGRGPTPVPGALVAALQTRCDAAGHWREDTRLQPGDQVTLTRGPLTEFVAKVEQIAPDQRVHLLMELMGAQTRVAVDAADLRVP